MTNEDADIERLIKQQFAHDDAYITDDGFVDSVMRELPQKKKAYPSLANIFYVLFTSMLLALVAWHLPIIGWYYDFTSWFIGAENIELIYITAAIFVSLTSTLWSIKNHVYFFRY